MTAKQRQEALQVNALFLRTVVLTLESYCMGEPDLLKRHRAGEALADALHKLYVVEEALRQVQKRGR